MDEMANLSTEASENPVVLHNVNKYFGKNQVLKDVSFCVQKGCIFGLLGPSGCGKTTTVKIMGGISEATSGEAFIFGKKMPRLELMSGIGYMAQSDALYMALSAEENLHFFAALYGMNKKQIANRVEEVMDLVNLRDHLKKSVGVYSGGMKRRLSLAMALLHDPEILILDEPTVGIDPLLRKTIWDELYNLAGQGKTIVVTTHVMDEAEKCHQLTMMREGRIIAQGTPKELQTAIGVNTIEEAFLYYGGKNHES